MFVEWNILIRQKHLGVKLLKVYCALLVLFIILWSKTKIVDFIWTSKTYFILSVAILQRWILCTGSKGSWNIPEKFPWNRWKALEPLSSSVAPVWISAAAVGTEAPWGAELLIQQAHFEASNKEISSSPRGKTSSLKCIQSILHCVHFLRANWLQPSLRRDSLCYTGRTFSWWLCCLFTLNYEPNLDPSNFKAKSSGICRDETGCHHGCVPVHSDLSLTDTLEAPLMSAGLKFLWSKRRNLIHDLITILLTT